MFFFKCTELQVSNTPLDYHIEMASKTIWHLFTFLYTKLFEMYLKVNKVQVIDISVCNTVGCTTMLVIHHQIIFN